MFRSLAVSSLRRFVPAAACVSAFLPSYMAAVVQVANGTPIENEDVNTVEVPLYFYADEAITAGQFDVSVPEGWSVLDVRDPEDLSGVFTVDADALEDGGVRVVLFSLNSGSFPVGSLGSIILEPPAVGSLASLSFSNPIFIGESGPLTTIADGFPQLQVVSQPASQTVLAGKAALLRVGALGIDTIYAWYEGPSGDTSKPVGGNSAVFQTEALLANASYWVRVSDTFGESVDSAVATITVDTGPTYIFTPNSRAHGWPAGTASASLETPVGNDWTASSSEDWLIVETSAGTGPGPIAYRFLANFGAGPRTAQISVGGVTFTVTQSTRPSLFADYPMVEGTAWRNVPWFGFVSDDHFPWVYHANHGWLFIYQTEDLNEFYAYSAQSELGWTYISTSFYNGELRWLYSFKFGTFLFFNPIDEVNPESRLFYRADTQTWFFYPES
jgi:hypothetical protein